MVLSTSANSGLKCNEHEIAEKWKKLTFKTFVNRTDDARISSGTNP